MMAVLPRRYSSASEAMGVSLLAERRQLMAAVATQQQYQHLMERIEQLEGEGRDLREAYRTQRAKLHATSGELSEARGAVSSLTAELRRALEEKEHLETSGGSLRGQLSVQAVSRVRGDRPGPRSADRPGPGGEAAGRGGAVAHGAARARSGAYAA